MAIPFNFLQKILINDLSRNIGTEEQSKYLFGDERFDLSTRVTGKLLLVRKELVNLGIAFPTSGFFLPLFQSDFSFKYDFSGYERRDFNNTYSFRHNVSGQFSLQSLDSANFSYAHTGEFVQIVPEGLDFGAISFSGESLGVVRNEPSLAVAQSGELIKINKDNINYCYLFFTGFYEGAVPASILDYDDSASYCFLFYTGSYQGA